MKRLLFIFGLLALGLGTVSCRTGFWEPHGLDTFDPEGNPLGRYTFTYNEVGLRHTENGEHWDASAGQWITDYRISYSYNSEGIRIGALTEIHDAPLNEWIPSQRILYSYLYNGALHSESCQLWQDGVWTDSYVDRYVYDGDGVQLYVERSIWDTLKVTRDFNLRGFISVNAHVQAQQTGWKNLVRDAFVYNSQNEIIGGIVQEWQPASQTWQDAFRYLYTKDNKGNILYESEEQWKKETGLWVSLGRYVYTYDAHNNCTECRYQPFNRQERNTYLIFYYNNTSSVLGYYLGDSGLYPGTRGTVTYHRQHATQQ